MVKEIVTPRIKEIDAKHVPKYVTGEEGEKHVMPIYISILRTRCYTESYKETEGEPAGIRRAKAFAHYLDTMPIYIPPHVFIAGSHVEDQQALLVDIQSFDKARIEEYVNLGFIKDNEIDEWHEYIEYWNKRNLSSMLTCLLTEEEKRLTASGAGEPGSRYIECRPVLGTSRTMPDNDLYLEVGLNKIVETLYQKLASLYKVREQSTGAEVVEVVLKINDVKAMLISAEAFLRWTNRYSELAKRMAKEEKDPQRKEELMAISEICSWVPGNPPRSFWEAVQSHWFTYLGYHVIEHACHGASFRLDQIFWPWYEKDVLVNQTLPREKALEMMQNLLLAVDEIAYPDVSSLRKNSIGSSNFLATYTIGGVKPEDGSDACNELTILILDAIDGLRSAHPDFKFRWHNKVNPKVWKRVVEVVRSGLGNPSIKNDEVIIPGLMHHYGFTLEEARSWANVGCVSPGVTIHWGTVRREAISYNMAKSLELALNNGVDPIPVPAWKRDEHQVGPKTGDPMEFTSYEEVFEALRKQVGWALQKAQRIKNLGEYCNTNLKRPFASCFFHRSLDACRDIMDVQTKGMPWVNIMGRVDVVDALISLKKIVFVDKKYTMEEVMKALRADWVGYEEMRMAFINAPKFGNDDDFADEVAKQVFTMTADEANKVKDLNGASPMLAGQMVTYTFSYAPLIGALPNGRKLGDWLADGGINPYSGYDRSGPMTAILSAAKIDATKQKADIFNQKLAPLCVEGDIGLTKLQSYLEAALRLGLDMIQLNVVDVATLRDAQLHPEQYHDLIVRVAGYCAHFTHLNKFVQEGIIARTEHVIA